MKNTNFITLCLLFIIHEILIYRVSFLNPGPIILFCIVIELCCYFAIHYAVNWVGEIVDPRSQ